jgi:lipopolysaccharide biosynthesis glycosyltransferase
MQHELALTDNAPVIVCGADDKFAMPLAVTVFSALTNLRGGAKARIFILDGGITSQNRQKIANVFKASGREFDLEWMPFDLLKIKAVRETNHLSKAAYLRILIPALLPEHISKAIYLDSDMIVEADVAELWDVELSDKAAMGVQDYYFPYVSSTPALSNYKDLELSESTPYCNSGLIVMNLQYWRKKNVGEKIFDHLRRNPDCLDQDGINAVIAGNWLLLDPRWNVSLSSVVKFGEELLLEKDEIDYYRQEFRINPFIIHFTSCYKPWHTGSKNKEALNVFYYDQSYRERYFYYLRQSGWFNKAYSLYWVKYRKLILFFQYKLQRRIKLFFNKPL